VNQSLLKDFHRITDDAVAISIGARPTLADACAMSADLGSCSGSDSDNDSRADSCLDSDTCSDAGVDEGTDIGVDAGVSVCADVAAGTGAAPTKTAADSCAAPTKTAAGTGVISANIHSGHRLRMKERFIKEGLDSFSDHQILELLLFFGIPYKDTNAIAHGLLQRYGSVSAVLEADYEELSHTKWIGANAAVLLKLIPEITRRYYNDRWKERPQLSSSTKAGEYALPLFIGLNHEVFYLICLDSQNRVNMAVPVFKGTINEAPVYPRLIVENALRYKANSVIFAHNHPGGSVNASNADVEVTLKLKTALDYISVKVADHIIVAGKDYISMAEQGLVSF